MRRTPFGAVVLLWAAAAASLGVPAAMQGPPGGAGVEMVDGRETAAREVLVRFRGPLRPVDLTDLAAQADADRVDRIGGAGVVRLRSRSLDAAALVAVMSRRGDVLYAEPNYVLRTFAGPNDASFPQLWALENVGQSVNGGLPGTYGSDIGAVPAWDISVGSAAHVVAVIDTGIDYTHPDLAANMWSAPAPFTVNVGGTVVHCAAGTHGFNAVTRTCNPMDDRDHGSHVAGTIGASGNDGIGVVGVNWTTRLMGIKFLDASGSGTIAGAVDAIRFAIEARRALKGNADVRVLSASWGGSGFSQALLDEILAAGAEDMLFVAAAGNSGLSNDSFPTYPASYNAPNIIAVAATTNTDSRAWFSSYGAGTVHLGAPGVDILSTTPGNGYMFASGTSMATPHVSGAAALVLSHCALDTEGLKDALLGTVEPVAALASATITGGRLNVHSAIHSCVAPPTTPEDLMASAGDGQVLLTWSASLGATGYRVKRGLTSGGPYATIAPDVKGGRYIDKEVVNGTTYYYVVSARNPLGESDDSNEVSATPNRKSDLVVSTLTVPGASGAGSIVAVAATTTNQGGGPAAASITRLHLSANASWDAGDLPLDPVHEVPALEPGESSSVSLPVTIPADTAPGRWYIVALADANRVIDETLESNNTRARSLLIGPDLVVSALSTPSTAGAGEAISVSDTVKNQGGAPAAASLTSYYLSSNLTLDASDTLLAGARSVPSLDIGASSAGTATVTIPAGTPAARYYLIAKADAGDAVAESMETNNVRTVSILIGADLTVSAFSAPSTGGAGLSIAVTDTTGNKGSGDAGASVTRFYFSANLQLDASDVLLGARPVPSLAAGASNSGTTTLTIPPGTPTGTHYLLAVADGEGTVIETIESNNQYARSIQIGPDLRIPTLAVPASAGAGSSILVSDTTTNQGGGGVGPTTTRYYFSTNAQLDAEDGVLGGRAVPGLDAGASHAGSATVTIPAGVTSGTYYILARADATDAVTETQEGNNVSSRTIQIGGDLAISAFTVPSKAGAGSTIVVSETTVNQGTASVPASVTRFYLSANAGLDGSDILLPASRAVPELAAGASSSGSTTLTIPAATSVGVYYLFAKADGDGAIVETQENNNTALRSIQIGPDLAVSALSVPTKVEPGAPIAVTETTVNQGGGAAPSSVTTFALSANFSLDDNDIVLDGSRVVGPLGPGTSSSGTTNLTIPAGTTPGTYYVIARSDAGGSVAETSESNNTRSQSTRIGPDLAVSTTSLSPSSVKAGLTATVSDTVVNQGAGLAAPSTTRFYLSTNLTFDAADVLLTGSRAVPALATNATSSGTTVITIPADTVPGTYYVLAKADADEAVAESLETNNVRTVRSVTVAAP